MGWLETPIAELANHSLRDMTRWGHTINLFLAVKEFKAILIHIKNNHLREDTIGNVMSIQKLMEPWWKYTKLMESYMIEALHDTA